VLHIDKYNEDHLFTMPKVHVEGLMTFQIAPELNGTSYIHSSSGYTTKIDYSCKGWLRGKSNSFVATLFRDGAEETPLYTAKGQWSSAYTIEDRRGKTMETVDLTSLRRTPLQTLPIEQQHPLETERAWQHVIKAINKNDIFAVGHEKGKIENAQRALRKQEQAENRTWERRYFTLTTDDAVVGKLAIRNKDEKDFDASVWRFDHAKHETIIQNQINGVKSPTRTRFQSVDSGVGWLTDDAAALSLTTK
jgi:hypothetical protein